MQEVRRRGCRDCGLLSFGRSASGAGGVSGSLGELPSIRKIYRKGRRREGTNRGRRALGVNRKRGMKDAHQKKSAGGRKFSGAASSYVNDCFVYPANQKKFLRIIQILN